MATIEGLRKRVKDLEEKLARVQQDQTKMRGDMDFYEQMLLEEYRLLLKILGEESDNYRIHRK